MTEQTNKLQYSEFQQRVMVTPQEFDCFLGGGRGGSKSYTIVLLILRLVVEYKQKARILFVRKTYKGLSDFEALCLEVFRMVYGKSVKFNQAEHIFRFPNGAYLELGQLEGPGDYDKYQGRSFSMLVVDEAQQYATPELLDRLRSNLRGPKDMPIRQIMAANPGGAGHHWLAHRYVFKAKPWEPFYEEHSKRTWVYAPSTYKDNPFIDQAEYEEQVRASCPHDEELLRAWLEGDWAVAKGAFFASVLEENRNAVDPWPSLPVEPWGQNTSDKWLFFLAHDFGSSAPSVTYIVAKSPGDIGPDEKFYPRGSLILVDELATSIPGQPSQGLGWTIDRLADAIKNLWELWGLKGQPRGVADDACFAAHGHRSGSIADEFKAYKIRFEPAKKGSRQYGWEVMRRMLSDAGKPDKPGLYISRKCSYFWETVPYLSRDPRNPEDLDSREPDHAADAVRYGCIYRRAQIYPFAPIDMQVQQISI